MAGIEPTSSRLRYDAPGEIGESTRTIGQYEDEVLAATVASITGESDVYNIVDDDPLPVAQWMPAFARWVDAPASRRLGAEDALDTAGEEAVYYHTRLSGASNPRAREKLGFSPRALLWK
ncbi:hypothetical protein [Burkholderia gladioli]|uniref:hypothetical protein n=1 Tax=Burkholderia gladioli TaxID=28095 RepID=UPI001ABA83CC|nr:hypothetical protein [Burkholderia gladioli]